MFENVASFLSVTVRGIQRQYSNHAYTGSRQARCYNVMCTANLKHKSAIISEIFMFDLCLKLKIRELHKVGLSSDPIIIPLFVGHSLATKVCTGRWLAIGEAWVTVG